MLYEAILPSLDVNPPIVICGPTASGKTALGLRVAERLPTPAEIISVDSRQIYRRLDIGTAKPDANERGRVRHHLIGVIDPDETFSAARFARFARQVTARLQSAGVTPIYVGGSGLYFSALLDGIFADEEGHDGRRQPLLDRIESEGVAALHAELAEVDPLSAQRISRHEH